MFIPNDKKPFTVKELIEFLQHAPQDIPISMLCHESNTREYLELCGWSCDRVLFIFQPKEYFKEFNS